MASKLNYVLITPARNEEAFIGAVIRCVVDQTHRPARWVIVSDGSTDRTDEIVRSNLEDHPWIHFIRMPPHGEHNFSSKVECFNAGLRRLNGIDYDVLGNLDADLTFVPDYFEFLMSKFEEDPSLGVAGTPFAESGGKGYDYRFTSLEHVSGACQMFRKECFVDIGGYIPIPTGGIDWVAVTTARMKGWRTRTFTERLLVHHRVMGSRGGKIAGIGYRMGIKDYNRGNTVIWELLRCIYQARYRPLLIGSISMLVGYTLAFVSQRPRPISIDLIQFSRKEQADRLRAKFAVVKSWCIRGSKPSRRIQSLGK